MEEYRDQLSRGRTKSDTAPHTEHPESRKDHHDNLYKRTKREQAGTGITPRVSKTRWAYWPTQDQS